MGVQNNMASQVATAKPTIAATPARASGPGHKRTTSSILKSLVTPRSQSPKKPEAQPQSKAKTAEITLKPFQLPPLSFAGSLGPLQPPCSPCHNVSTNGIAQASTRASHIPSPTRTHKKSISVSSFGQGSPTKERFSVDIARNSIFKNSEGNAAKVLTPSSPGKEKMTVKARSTLDFSKLKQKVMDKSSGKAKEPDIPKLNKGQGRTSPTKATPVLARAGSNLGRSGTKVERNKENQAPTASSSPKKPRFGGILSGPTTPGSAPSQFVPKDRPKSYFEQQRAPSHFAIPSPRGSIIQDSSRGSPEQRVAPPTPRQEIQDPITLYTPQAYTPSSQRNFEGQGYEVGLKPRPKSAYYTQTSGNSYQASDDTGIAGQRACAARSSDETNRMSIDDPKRSRPGTAASNSSSGKMSAKSGGTKEAPIPEVDHAFESLLETQGIPENMRQKLRLLDIKVKRDFIRNGPIASYGPSVAAPSQSSQPNPVATLSGLFTRRAVPIVSTTKASTGSPPKLEPAFKPEPQTPATKRSRSKTLPVTEKKEQKEQKDITISPTKKRRGDNGNEKPALRIKSILFTPSAPVSSGERSPTRSIRSTAQPISAEEFVDYLRLSSSPSRSRSEMKDIDVEKLHKLRLCLRNERIQWVDSFIGLGGMARLIDLLYRCMHVEWREDHEDQILHELLLCLKALCTARLALEQLLAVEDTLFPRLVDMIFDEERKGPSEFSTRMLVFNILFAHLSAAPLKDRQARAFRLLKYLSDKVPEENARPIDFIAQIHTKRPYKRWCKEVVNVSKEVFWIFLHPTNIIPLPRPESRQTTPEEKVEAPYQLRHFPAERPPVPAAPYVGGVEYEATKYLSAHIDLLNGIIASFGTKEERYIARLDMRNSGWEKCLGGSLRLCKASIHTWLHEGLKTWVAAAAEDEWAINTVRYGTEGTPRPGSFGTGGGAIELVKQSPITTPLPVGMQSPGKKKVVKKTEFEEKDLRLPSLNLGTRVESQNWEF